MPDEGYDGAVVCMSRPCSDIELIDETKIRAGSGATLAATAVFAAEHSLTGLEFAHGIPGSVGGGTAMNAGAYGGEMRDVIESVEFVDLDGRIRTLGASELGMSYRHSVFSDTDKLITSVTFALTPGDAGGHTGTHARADRKAPRLPTPGYAQRGQAPSSAPSAAMPRP